MEIYMYIVYNLPIYILYSPMMFHCVAMPQSISQDIGTYIGTVYKNTSLNMIISIIAV